MLLSKKTSDGASGLFPYKSGKSFQGQENHYKHEQFSSSLTGLVFKACICIFDFTCSFTINLFNKSSNPTPQKKTAEANTSQAFVLTSMDLKLIMFC